MTNKPDLVGHIQCRTCSKTASLGRMLCSALLNILRGPLEDLWFEDVLSEWEMGLKKVIGSKKRNHRSS